LSDLQKMVESLRVEEEGDETKRVSGADPREMQFEPNPSVVLAELLPLYINQQIYHLVLSAKASEHSARMVAMRNATQNAKEMISDLTLAYNKLRQANITKELLEISSAAMAVS
jgi:F-type H+-transporting ATPase subunit gamma